MFGYGHRSIKMMSLSIASFVVLSSFAGLFLAAAPASAAPGDLIISGPFTIQNEVYYVDGNVVVQSTGTLTIRDAELRIMSDDSNIHTMTVDGGKLIMDGGVITTYLDTVHSWPLLTLTLQNGATVTATNGSALIFPGDIVSTGAGTKVTLTDTNITKLASLTYLDPGVLDPDYADNGPAMTITDSTWELYDSWIWNLPEGLLNRADLVLAGGAQFTAVNSYISVDFDNQTISPSTKNVISLSNDANAYLYGCTFASPSVPFGDSAFVATTTDTNDAGGPANPVMRTKHVWDNATGQVVTSLWMESDGPTYQVLAQRNMAVFNANVTGIPASDVLAVTLVVKYSTGATYAGARALNYTLGGVTKSLSIVPAASENVRTEVDMFSLGVDTISEVNTLLISFFNSGNTGAGDIQFDALYMEVVVGPQAYIYRWADITVKDMYGVPLSSSTITAKFNSSTWIGTRNVYWYTPSGIANDPAASVLTYMGKTVGNYKVTDSAGKTLIPYLTDIVSGLSSPGSVFVGTLNMTATHSTFSKSVQVALEPYPLMSESNTTTKVTITIDGDTATSWDTSRYLIVPPSLTFSFGGYIHYGDIICKSGGTLTISNYYFMISREPGETSRVLIASGGTLRISESLFESDQPVSIDVMDGGTLVIDSSNISSEVDINVLGDATVQIVFSHIGGALTVSSDAAASIDIRDSVFLETPVIAGTSVANLANVTAPALSIIDNAKVYLYRWMEVIVTEDSGYPLLGAAVFARWQLNDTLYRSGVTGPAGVVQLKLIACTMFATNDVVTVMYYGNYRINASYTYGSIVFSSPSMGGALDPYTSPLAVNNPIITLAVPIDLPDLSVGVDGAYISPSPTTEGLTTNVYLQVANTGDADATTTFTVDFYYDVIDVPHLIGTDAVGPLGSGAVTLAQVVWADPPAGSHTLYALINQGHTIVERDYLDNNASAAITVWTMPDLYISNVFAVLNGQPIAPGDDIPSSNIVTIHVLIHNGGETPVSTPITVTLYNGSVSAANRIAHQNTTGTLSQGGTREPTFDYQVMTIYVPSATVDIIAVVNPSPAQGGYPATYITESNYSNNEMGMTLNVIDSRPDPSVTTDGISIYVNQTVEISTQDNNVSYGNALTIVVTVTNDGLTAANQVSVMVNISGMATDVSVGNVQYIDLNASESKQVNFTYIVTVKYSGPYTINVTLDLENAVQDKDRSNNNASRALNVSYIEPKINVISPVGKDRNVSAGQTMVVYGNVKYPDDTPMIGVNVTIVLQTLTGVNISAAVTVKTVDPLGTFSATIQLPNDIDSGDYKLVVVVGQNSQEVPIKVTPAGGGIDSWMLIIIIAAIGAGVLIFSLYIYKQGVGKLVECGECGALIPESAKKCPKCGVEFEEDMVKCSECGAWIAAASVECPNCHVRFGTPLEGEKGYEEKMKDQYEETVLAKYRELAKGDLGKKYSEESFQEWWMATPAYISFEDWLAKEDERRKQANLVTCAVCGTPNAKDSAVCHNCGSPLAAEGAEAAAGTPEGVVIEKRVIRKPIDRKIVPKKVIKKPLDQDQQQGGQQQQ